MKKNVQIIYFFLFSGLLVNNTFAEDLSDLSTEERLIRLERMVNSNGMIDVMVRVESMQSELQRLQGEIEVQKHTLVEIKKRQRDLYIDIDRRLLQIERGSGVSSSSLPPLSKNSDGSDSNAVKSSNSKGAKKSGDSQSEQIAYQKAFDLLKASRYDKATRSFRQFLNDYPDGRYAHIAQYWLAETSYHTRKFDIAVKDYEKLIEEYPKSPKRADALLKIGYSQFELKEYSKVKTVLNKLIKSYPGTTEAGQAKNLLQKIRLQNMQ